MTFLAYGRQVPRIGIYGSWCGTGIAWWNENPGHESAPGHSHERRHTAQERAMDREGAATARVAVTHALDHATPARIIAVTGPVRSQYRRAEPGDPARSRADARSEITHDPSRSWADYGAGFRVGDRYPRTVWLRQAGG